jgi:hypothetical protein
MTARRKKPPEHIRCENPACGRLLLADGYTATIPPGISAERIHREYTPDEPLRTVMCTCGHYTQHSPYPLKAT